MAGLLDGIVKLFGGATAPAARRPLSSTRAYEILRRLNPNGLIGEENGCVCMIEDHTDPDGRMFRLEYQSTRDGRHAVAWCRHNPWGSVSDTHTTNGGLICVGPGGHGPRPASSRYNLEFVVTRARFWCTAISVYHETGNFPNL